MTDPTCSAAQQQSLRKPSDYCDKSYTPEIHDAERAALFTKFNDQIGGNGLAEIWLDEHFERSDYRTHVVAHVCRELEALGWFTHIRRNGAFVQNRARKIAVLLVSDVPDLYI